MLLPRVLITLSSKFFPTHTRIHNVINVPDSHPTTRCARLCREKRENLLAVLWLGGKPWLIRSSDVRLRYRHFFLSARKTRRMPLTQCLSARRAGTYTSPLSETNRKIKNLGQQTTRNAYSRWAPFNTPPAPSSSSGPLKVPPKYYTGTATARFEPLPRGQLQLLYIIIFRIYTSGRCSEQI